MPEIASRLFWSSADLTGNQTSEIISNLTIEFWSSADLTGNQTAEGRAREANGFGAVPI